MTKGDGKPIEVSTRVSVTVLVSVSVTDTVAELTPVDSVTMVGVINPGSSATIAPSGTESGTKIVSVMVTLVAVDGRATVGRATDVGDSTTVETAIGMDVGAGGEVGVGVGINSPAAIGVGVTVGKNTTGEVGLTIVTDGIWAVTETIGVNNGSEVGTSDWVSTEVGAIKAGAVSNGTTGDDGTTVTVNTVVVVRVSIGRLVGGTRRTAGDAMGGGVSASEARAWVGVARIASNMIASRSSARLLNTVRDSMVMSVA